MPDVLQNQTLFPQAHQSRRRLCGTHDLLRRRLEAEHQRRQAEPCRLLANPVENPLVAEVHAVEDADGRHAPGLHRLNSRPGPAEYMHGNGARQKRRIIRSPDHKFRIRRSAGRKPTASSAAK